MGDWPIILPIFLVGFVCGGCWIRARPRYMANRRLSHSLRIRGRFPRSSDGATQSCADQPVSLGGSRRFGDWRGSPFI